MLPTHTTYTVFTDDYMQYVGKQSGHKVSLNTSHMHGIATQSTFDGDFVHINYNDGDSHAEYCLTKT